jgi:hypothetical protein
MELLGLIFQLVRPDRDQFHDDIPDGIKEYTEAPKTPCDPCPPCPVPNPVPTPITFQDLPIYFN